MTRKVEYLGPDELFSFVFESDKHTFEKGHTYDLKDSVAEQCLALNPRGLDVAHANNYGAKVFREVKKQKEAPIDLHNEEGGDRP